MHSGLRYVSDVGILKKYRDDYYKLIHCFSLRNSGVDESPAIKGSAGHTSKLEESLIRTKSTVHEIALCNDWGYMVTLTLDPQKYDRYKLKPFLKDLGKFLNNYNYQRRTSIKYLLIPEEHKDGAWHMHGLFAGIPPEHLSSFIRGVHPQFLIDNGYLNWKAYAERFGFCSFGAIRNAEGCAAYITKYITKQLQHTSIEVNSRLFYASKGLKRAEVVRKERIARELDADFRNDYVAVKRLHSLDEAQQYFFDDKESLK
jgi:hypothetical protein